MPSSPNYKRDYVQEHKTAKARGETGVGKDSGNAVRGRARYEAIKLGMIKPGSKMDIDHKKPLVKGGSETAPSNLRPRTPHANRSFKRTKTAGMA
jgi:hypothetical protein